MQVVLIKDVKNLGRSGTVHTVSDGHALNLLIPRKLAIQATPAALRQAEAANANAKQQSHISETLIRERIAALADGRVVVTRKANEQGSLYDAVDAKDIAEAAQLPVDAIALEKPIKQLGQFDVAVSYGIDFGTIVVAIEEAA